MTDDDPFEIVAPVAIESPCTLVCTIDTATGWCLGCGRTIPEIMDWSAKPADERRAIRASLPPRMAALKAKAG